VNSDEITFTYEPRCKICRSQHRSAIDGMLLDSVSQAEVLRYWNGERRTNWLSPSGVSRHARRHLDRRFKDMSLFDSLPFLELGRSKPRQREVLEAILDGGLAALNAGIVVVEPRDMLAAWEQHENVELRDADRALQRLLRHFDLFRQALEVHIPLHIQEAVLDDYVRLVEESADRHEWED